MLDHIEHGYADHDGVGIHYVTLGRGPLIVHDPWLSRLLVQLAPPDGCPGRSVPGRGLGPARIQQER